MVLDTALSHGSKVCSALPHFGRLRIFDHELVFGQSISKVAAQNFFGQSSSRAESMKTDILMFGRAELRHPNILYVKEL